MSQVFSLDFSIKSFRFTAFLFFGLLLMSTAFFVFADEATSTKNIFQDSDQDGLSNDEEKLYGTNPSVKDSDGDGYGDGIEIESGYNPLKAAPGDKIIQESSSSSASAANARGDSENLTQKVSSEIVSMLKNTEKSGEAVSLETLNESVQKVIDGSSEVIVLPEVNIEDIKIKKSPSNKLSEKKRIEEERADITEYLTVVSYILANNSPQSFRTEDELAALVSSLSAQSISGLVGGNSEKFNELSGIGEKILEQLKDVAVPEKMLELHVKALKLAKYSVQLKNELKMDPSDPFGQIAEFSKWQGFLGVVSDYTTEMEAMLIEYGIQGIPIDL